MSEVATGTLYQPHALVITPATDLLNGNLPAWYTVYTSPRHEKRVSWHFGQRQIESFLPLYEVTHHWKNRCTAQVQLPLFPSYIFTRIDPRERVRVLNVPGVLGIVRSGRDLLPVPDEYIVSLRAGLRVHRIEPCPDLAIGDRVRILAGPMAGMEGILQRKRTELRVVIRVEMLARSIAVEITASDIESAGPSQAHAFA